MTVKRPASPSPAKAERQLTPEDWIEAARATLVAEGIDQVKVQKLARKLGVSRGSFYWHFHDRKQLLDELLKLWERANTRALIDAMRGAGRPLEERMLSLFTLWLTEQPFDPKLDSAMRDWARKSPQVRRALEEADHRRLAEFETLFRESGYPPQEAEIRALVLYYTQVGYYTLGLEETAETRLGRLEPYYFAFTGRQLSPQRAKQYRQLFLSQQKGGEKETKRRRRAASPPPQASAR